MSCLGLKLSFLIGENSFYMTFDVGLMGNNLSITH